MTKNRCRNCRWSKEKLCLFPAAIGVERLDCPAFFVADPPDPPPNKTEATEKK